jgi:RND superfamily putative drug exporter
MAHRRRVVLAWLALAVVATVASHAVGPNYVTVYSLPGTDSQRAHDLLVQDFNTQSGDIDSIVFHVSHGTIDAPAVRAAIAPLLTRVSRLDDVTGVVSP